MSKSCKLVYINITKILLDGKGTNTSIFRMYFSYLFNPNYYTPEEILNIYRDAEEELKQIYFKCLAECNYIDYKGKFLSEFILNDIDWIKWYARYIQKMEGNYWIDDKEYRMDTCWKQDNFLNTFDVYFDEFLHNKPLYWDSRSHLQKILSCETQKEINSRKEQWIIHYIRERSDNDNLIELFEILQDLKKEIRKKAILYFLECNPDFELFRRLSLVSNSWTGTSSITNKIIFYEELLSEISGVQFLKHKKQIKDEIAKWKAIRNREEVDEILMKLYQ